MADTPKFTVVYNTHKVPREITIFGVPGGEFVLEDRLKQDFNDDAEALAVAADKLPTSIVLAWLGVSREELRAALRGVAAIRPVEAGGLDVAAFVKLKRAELEAATTVPAE